MVQKKLSNKISIHPKNSIKPEKKHSTTKPSLQNHDVKNKVADSKAIKMKKSRWSKRSSTKSHEEVEPPPTLGVTRPTKTPSPKKPNYMKGTNSSELHKVGKTLNKVRTLTKAPSFKHSRITGTRKKAVLCETIDAQRATCSSTLKDYKFPTYLKLAPGATEAEGTSAMKVCPYTYCSLNGHRHDSVPPLSSFLALKRRMVKTQKNVTPPEVVSSGKRKRSEVKITEDDCKIGFMLEDTKDDFFVEIHVPRHDHVDVSEIDFQDDVDLSDMNFSPEENPDKIKVTENDSEVGFILNDESAKFDDEEKDGFFVNLSDMYFDSEERALSLSEDQESSEGYYNASDLEMERDSSVSLDQIFGEVSDMEWEEGQALAFDDEKVEFPVQKDCGVDETEPVFEFEKFVEGKLLPYIYDEIMELLQFSDADTASDSESTQTDGDYIEEQIVDDDQTVCVAKVEEGSFEGRESSFSNLIEEVTKDENDGLDSLTEDNEANGDEWNSEIYLLKETGEGDGADVVMEETNSSEFFVKDIPVEAKDSGKMNPELEISINGDNCQGVKQSKAENLREASFSCFDESQQLPEENTILSDIDAISEENYSNEVKHESTKNYVEEVTSIRNEIEQLHNGILNKENDSIDVLLNSSNRLKKTVRRKKTAEDIEESRDFNPRPPNFLPVEPEPESEKVDLRHQDMDERRNAEDWMLDHALQKTVSQLGPARKKKVALLVQAFEAVLPIPQYEPHMRRNSSSFAHARIVQACR